MNDKAVTPQTLNQLKNLWNEKRRVEAQLEKLEARKHELNKQIAILELSIRDRLTLTPIGLDDLEIGKVVAYQKYSNITLFEIAAWGDYEEESCIVTSTDNVCYHVAYVKNIS